MTVGENSKRAVLWARVRRYSLVTPNGAWRSAQGINDHRQIIGAIGYGSSDDKDQAVLWSDGRVIDLPSRLSPGAG